MTYLQFIGVIAVLALAGAFLHYGGYGLGAGATLIFLVGAYIGSRGHSYQS